MPIEILMPALSPTMTEGNLAKWHKNEGDKVKPGDVLAEIETDKAIMEVEAVDAGIIGKILVSQGTKSVEVNQPIALLLEDGEDKKALDGYKVKSAKASAENKQVKEQKSEVKESANRNVETARPSFASPLPSPFDLPGFANKNGSVAKKNDASLKVSPLAKRVALNAGVDVARIEGTGPNGRVVKEDVERFLRYGSGGLVHRQDELYVERENSQMRKVIASRLLQSKQYVPHFYLTIECNIDKLLEARHDLNAAAPHDNDNKPCYKVSVNDMIIKAVALALKKNPKVNASWTDESIIEYTNIDVSVAVAIEAGLITPIIKNADQKSIAAISIEMKQLALRAKTTGLKPEEFQGGGFSISNLGMFGIKEFSAIINPPQSAIMAVGAAEKRAVVVDDKVVVANMMNVTLSCDHRVVDGALAAQFLSSFKGYIEKPVTLFI